MEMKKFWLEIFDAHVWRRVTRKVDSFGEIRKMKEDIESFESDYFLAAERNTYRIKEE
jgi:hypothetical protein